MDNPLVSTKSKALDNKYNVMKRDFKGCMAFYKLKTKYAVQCHSTSEVKIRNSKESEYGLTARLLSKHFN